MLALLAAIILAPLLYIPGWLIAHALLGAAQPLDMLERHYERVVVGALLNGWLAFTLAELGIFSAWLHLLLILLICAGCIRDQRQETRDKRPETRDQRQETRDKRPETRGRGQANLDANGVIARLVSRVSLLVSRVSPVVGGRWSVVGGREALAFAAVGLLFALLVARPFEVVLGVRDAGVYANIGFVIARTGSIVQHDPLLAQIGQDQDSADEGLRKAAEQAETNFLGNQHEHRNIATRLRSAGFYINEGDLSRGRVVPQFFHLFPAWIGLLAALLGMHGGLLATGVLGFLGLWSVGMLGRRLAGPWVGLLGMLFLGLNGVQVWFSRYSTSEAAVQFLTFAGLYAFAVMATTDGRQETGDRRQETGDRRQETTDNGQLMTDDRRPTTDDRELTTDHGQQTRSENSKLKTQNSKLTRPTFAALLAGLAFGQVALARVDFVLVVGPPLVYLFYVWLTRRWSRIHTWLAAGLGAMLLHAALHVVFIARAYFFDTLSARLQDYALSALIALPFQTPVLQTYWLSRGNSKIGIRLGPGEYLWNWQRIATEIAIVVLVCACIWALRRWGQPLIASGERLIRRWAQPLLWLSAAGIVALATYAYLIRPQILTPQLLAELPACLSSGQLSAPGSACLKIQGYIGAPIAVPDYDRATYTKPLANMVRVGWYLSPLGVALAVAGLALWWRRGLSRASWLFLAVGLLAAVFFIRQSYGTSDQAYIYILRRYIPQVYPAFSLGMAYALVALAGRRRTTDDGRPTTGAGRTKNQEPRTITEQRTENKEQRGQNQERAPAGSTENQEQAPAGSTENRKSGTATLSPCHLVILSSCRSRIRLLIAATLALALIGFLAVTNRAIYGHVEYAGALAQLGAIAGRFGPDDVLLFHSGSRDEPDLVATPLKYAFDLNAFTIKSTNPENYAPQIARYVQRWQEQGRNVYLIFGPSGGFGLPGLRFEPDGRMALEHLQEFEQLTDQKPHNVQDLNLDFAVYRIEPAVGAPPAISRTIAVDDYAAQARGFYRAEQIAGTALAWTQGDALLRLPWPRDGAALKVTIELAGGRRPAALGPAQACMEFWPEENGRFDPPGSLAGGPGCFELGEQMAHYTFTLDPRSYPASGAGAILLRIHSDTWVPAEVDPAQIDRRVLGVQFGGMQVGE